MSQIGLDEAECRVILQTWQPFCRLKLVSVRFLVLDRANFNQLLLKKVIILFSQDICHGMLALICYFFGSVLLTVDLTWQNIGVKIVKAARVLEVSSVCFHLTVNT